MKSNKRRVMTKEDFIQKATSVHGDTYDYSLVPDTFNLHDKIPIICKVHGVTHQVAASHLKGCRCRQCSGLSAIGNDEFIRRSTEKHNGKYDYSKVVYKNIRTKVTIICPEHGEFTQTAKNHINGQGCPICGQEAAKNYHKFNWSHFVEESHNRFGDLYTFPNIENEYVNSHSDITIVCNRCGKVFKKIACDHITSNDGGCQRCSSCKSKGELEIAEHIINKLGADAVSTNDRKCVDGFEIDIYIPSKKIAIEYNGIYWHSSAHKDKLYHLRKLEKCNSLGIKLVQVFEDEYVMHKDIVLSKIDNILCLSNSTRIMARKCTVAEIDNKTAKQFLEENHIQGYCASTVHIGIKYIDTLVGVMSFKRSTKSGDTWELTRYATKLNTNVQGGGSKLLKYFIQTYKPSSIKSFADKRWTTSPDNNLYTKLGFTLDGSTQPDYRYISGRIGVKRVHKFNMRKRNLARKYGVDQTKTESELTSELGFHKIYDCGLYRYVLTNIQYNND